ncbi:MAG: glycosyltransferase family 87 protein [Desulfobaccales bacterium]
MKVYLLTRERLRLVCWLLIITYVIFAVYQLGDLGPRTGGIKNSDFVLLWSASHLALGKDPGGVYSIRKLQQVQTLTLLGGDQHDLLPWLYFPSFLMLILPLGLLPYPVSLACWLGGTLWGALSILRRIAPDPLTRKLALAFPGIALNFFYSQGIFLLIFLMGGGLLAVDGYPLLAGLLLGVSISYKPHLGFLVLVAFLGGRRWRALGAMLATVGGLALLSAALFGFHIWMLFWKTIPLAKEIVATVSDVWPRMSSPFAGVRLVGGSLLTAWSIQGMVSGVVVVIAFWVWRQGAPLAIRASTLVVGALLASPYIFEYDLSLLSLPLAWMVWEGYLKGWRSWEKYWLPVVWLSPLLTSFLTKNLGWPLEPLILAIFLFLLVRRVPQKTDAES